MSVKNVVNWNYERASWQWDLFCVFCLIIIFGTPKSWFDHREVPANQTIASVVKVEDCGCETSQ